MRKFKANFVKILEFSKNFDENLIFSKIRGMKKKPSG